MTPGFHQISMEKYLADPCVVPSLNATVANVLIRESARKAWHCHPRLNPDYRPDHDDKFDIGTVAHAMLLERDTSRLVVVDADDWRTKAAKEQRIAARAEGKTALLARHVAGVTAMVATASAFIKQSEVGAYWDDAESEVTGIALEDKTYLRCRFDRITRNRRLIFDYKSTADAAPEAFSRQIVRMGYHIQEAFYRRIARNLGATGPRFVFVAQSVEPPYECSLHGCDPALQEIAEAEVERAIALWRSCMKAKEWPSYVGRIHYAIPTNYMIQEHELRLAEAA